ncbi:MAG: hypothetical protein K2K14_06390 [Ruminococcus sp.]|nr:hypothetical protein [Ruminococcus sp.]
MDNSSNNHNSEKPRKKVTKKVLRRRQLCALAVIALIVLILVILIANACTDKTTKPRDGKTTSSTTTTTTTTETEPITEPPTTTTTVPVPTADPALSAQVQLSKREMTLSPGETDLSYINLYPDGSGENNEVWSTTDPNVATVDEYGYVTAVNAGECFIILKFDNNPAIEVQIKVTVTGAVSATETPTINQPQGITPDVPQNTTDIQNNPGYQGSQGYQDTQNYYQNNQTQQESQPSQNNQSFPEVSNVMPEV